MADLNNEATRIFQSSMASNSWHVYKFAILGGVAKSRISLICRRRPDSSLYVLAVNFPIRRRPKKHAKVNTAENIDAS
jgi:hypothetical protein